MYCILFIQIIMLELIVLLIYEKKKKLCSIPNEHVHGISYMKQLSLFCQEIDTTIHHSVKCSWKYRLIIFNYMMRDELSDILFYFLILISNTCMLHCNNVMFFNWTNLHSMNDTNFHLTKLPIICYQWHCIHFSSISDEEADIFIHSIKNE